MAEWGGGTSPHKPSPSLLFPYKWGLRAQKLNVNLHTVQLCECSCVSAGRPQQDLTQCDLQQVPVNEGMDAGWRERGGRTGRRMDEWIDKWVDVDR